MAKFDANNIAGEEVKAAYALADLLAGLTEFQTLAEESTSTAARSHIVVGAPQEPDTADYTIDALANKGLQVWIDHSGGSRVAVVDGYSQTSESGSFVMHFRRYSRESELSDFQDLYLWFWDSIDVVHTALSAALAVATCPRVQQGAVTLLAGPHRETIGEEVSQGSYLWANYQVDWGDAADD